MHEFMDGTDALTHVCMACIFLCLLAVHECLMINRICFSTKNIDVSPLFGVILYCTFSEHLY